MIQNINSFYFLYLYEITINSFYFGKHDILAYKNCLELWQLSALRANIFFIYSIFNVKSILKFYWHLTENGNT